MEDVTTDEPGTDEPGTDEPGTDEPGTDEPGTDEPGTDEPGGSKSLRLTSSEGVDLTQIYELLALTPTQRVERLTQMANEIIALRAQLQPRSDP